MIREVLLVVGMISAIIGGLILWNPEGKDAGHSAPATEVEAVFSYELPLGDEFVCLVRLNRLGRGEAASQPSYFSRVCFALRPADNRAPCVLEVATPENRNWQLASCRVWTLLPREEVDAFLREDHRRATTNPDFTADERWRAEQNYHPPAVEPVSQLEAPLFACVPAELRDSLLVVSGRYGLHNLHESSDVPLARLAIAIQTAAARDRWTSEPTGSLLASMPAESISTLNGQRALAQSLVRRLLEFLPPGEETITESNSSDGTGALRTQRGRFEIRVMGCNSAACERTTCQNSRPSRTLRLRGTPAAFEQPGCFGVMPMKPILRFSS